MAVKKTPNKKRVSIAGVLLRLAFAGTLWAIVWGAINPDRAIPVGWNPLVPLRVDEPVTLFTNWRLERTIADPEVCLKALSAAAQFEILPDFEGTDQCHIKNRVDLAAIGQAAMKPVETRCGIALRVAMWERHNLQPAAQVMGTTLTGIDHIGSYNCREMRTTKGATGRMSSHAVAGAIDISGFQFADGAEARLIRDWNGDAAKADFLRAARDGACDWFGQTLSPDYNSLHADHFHLQSRGWGTCR